MNNRAVSEVIGVILMVSITVAIAATVYVYVSGMLEEQPTIVEVEQEGTNITLEWELNNVTKICEGYSFNLTADLNLLELAFNQNNLSNVPKLLEYGYENLYPLHNASQKYEQLYLETYHGGLRDTILRFYNIYTSSKSSLDLYKKQYEILSGE